LRFHRKIPDDRFVKNAMRLLRIALLLAIGLIISNHAWATVTVTVNGTATYGTDTSGVFGSAGANLAGSNLTLVYTLDETTGSKTYLCSIICYTNVNATTGATSVTISSHTYTDLSSSPGAYRAISGWAPTTYTETLGSNSSSMFSYATMSGATAINTGSTTPDFNWVSAFSDNTTTDTSMTSIGYFSISDGTNTASAYYTVTSVSVVPGSGACANVSPFTSVSPLNNATLSIDTSSSGMQPNIVGGTVNTFTTIKATLLGYNSSSGLYPVSLGDSDTAFTTSHMPPTTLNETLFAPGIVADPTTGIGSTNYYTSLTSGFVNDQVGGTICGTSAIPVPVYEYYPIINSGSGTQFDIGKSQVSDTVFQNSTDLDESGIQTFLGDQGTFLATLYLDTTNPSNGGWLNTSGNSTSTYSGSETVYCLLTTQTNRNSPRTNCPSVGDVGTRVSALISSAATNSSLSPQINPKLLLTKLQVEAHLLTTSTLPSSSSIVPADIDTLYNLDKALGCPRSTYVGVASQIACGASTFSSTFSEAETLTYPYFFPVDQTEKAALLANPAADIVNSIQYAYASNSGDSSDDGCQKSLHLNCDLVGFTMLNAATKVQYNYTPFVQTRVTGGGARLFEYLWSKYSAINWE
jgi:hypothetical protein